MLLTSEDFEKEIDKTKNPEIIIRDAKSSLLVKFLDSADRKFKDDVIGFVVVTLNHLQAFFTIPSIYVFIQEDNWTIYNHCD